MAALMAAWGSMPLPKAPIGRTAATVAKSEPPGATATCRFEAGGLAGAQPKRASTANNDTRDTPDGARRNVITLLPHTEPRYSCAARNLFDIQGPTPTGSCCAKLWFPLMR